MSTTNTNKRAPGACDTRGLGAYTNDLKLATGTRRSNAELNLHAILALYGFIVRHLRDAGYLVCKYGYSKHAVDTEKLQLFAESLGVRRA